MPNPNPGSVHVDQLLTNVSVGFVQDQTKFVGTKVFPLVPVNKQSGLYPVYNESDFMRDEVQQRAPGGRPPRLGYRTNNGAKYFCDEYAAEHPIDDQVRANADGPYNPEMDGTKFLTQKMMIKQDRDWVTTFFSTGLWTGTTDGAELVAGTDFVRFSNAASTPIETIQKNSRSIEGRTGFLPNKLVVGRQVWFDLRNHPDVVDRYKYTSADSITTQMVAKLFELDDIFVCGAIYDSAAETEGAATLDVTSGLGYIVGDGALLIYAAPAPSLLMPSAGYTFAWNGLAGSNAGVVMETYREDQSVSDILRIRANWDHKLVSAPCGVFYPDASTNV